jgi:hypothetical protein
MENTIITQRFFPGKPNRENQHILYSFIVIHCLQYNIHIGINDIQNCQALILAHYPLIGAYYISNVILFMLDLFHYL